MGLLDRVRSYYYIMAGNFNTILSQKEKKRVSLICEPHMEDLIASIHFIDIKPSKGIHLDKQMTWPQSYCC